MNEPLTELDSRFSDSDATATEWSTVVSILESAQLSWLSTVRADGRPHVTPLVSVWLDSAAYFCTGPDEQKAVNLSHHQDVVLITGCNDWKEGVDVMVEGRAERVTDFALLQRLAEAWATKWDGDWRFTPADDGFTHEEGGPVLVFQVAPTKVLAFGKGSFSHTRHVFSG